MAATQINKFITAHADKRGLDFKKVLDSVLRLRKDSSVVF